MREAVVKKPPIKRVKIFARLGARCFRRKEARVRFPVLFPRFFSMFFSFPLVFFSPFRFSNFDFELFRAWRKTDVMSVSWNPGLVNYGDTERWKERKSQEFHCSFLRLSSQMNEWKRRNIAHKFRLLVEKMRCFNFMIQLVLPWNRSKRIRPMLPLTLPLSHTPKFSSSTIWTLITSNFQSMSIDHGRSCDMKMRW